MIKVNELKNTIKRTIKQFNNRVLSHVQSYHVSAQTPWEVHEREGRGRKED